MSISIWGYCADFYKGIFYGESGIFYLSTYSKLGDSLWQYLKGIFCGYWEYFMGNSERIEWDIAEIDASMGDGSPKHLDLQASDLQTALISVLRCCYFKNKYIYIIILCIYIYIIAFLMNIQISKERLCNCVAPTNDSLYMYPPCVSYIISCPGNE